MAADLKRLKTIMNDFELTVEKDWIVFEPSSKYGDEYPLKEETYRILGCCFEVYNTLGRGFLEVIYKDALEIEFQLAGIPYEREKPFPVFYKDFTLKRKYNADFVVFGNIILEAKAISGIIDTHYELVLNYLTVSKCPIGLIVNFGDSSLKYKRVVKTK